MKKIFRKILIMLIITLGLALFVSNISDAHAASIIPTDCTTIYTNANNDITSDIDNNFGIFKFKNYGNRFVEVALTATSVKETVYPASCIQIKDTNYQLMKKCDISNFNTLAINSDGSNYMYVFLPSSGTYYIDVNYDMTNISKLVLRVSIVNSFQAFNMFDYGESENFKIDVLHNSKIEEVKQFTLLQASQFKIETNVNNNSASYRLVLVRLNALNSEEAISSIINIDTIGNYSTTVNLIEGTYCIGYYNLNIKNSAIDLSLTRNITSYGSSHLIPDPDKKTPCGSQITVDEKEINADSRSYRQNTITEGFTRLIYVNGGSNSRLNYYWYSSNENVAIITDYGTVLALPINTSQETVKIMAIDKNNMSNCYIKEFVIKNDSKTYATDPIDINLDMYVSPYKYTYIDLSNVDVPINLLQLYSWRTDDNITVDGWGRIYARDNQLGKKANIVGTYLYNEKVKIHVSVLCMLPLSGYELDYEPNLWGGIVENNVNCYGYALNNQLDPKTSTLWFKQQPGEFANAETNDITNEVAMYNAVKADFDAYNKKYGTNLIFERIGKYDICPEGTYKVALVASTIDQDYHWYRQDSDGYWSHKRGRLPVTRYDADGNLIADPETCNRDTYDIFLGFYMISPWNNMAISTMSISSIDDFVNEPILGIDSVPTISSHLVESIKVGMTIDEVSFNLGTLGYLSGSGAIIHQYYLNDGRTLIVHYAYDNETYVISKIIVD